jgi:RNA polymerase sigma-70 factor (ECF subfamily)
MADPEALFAAHYHRLFKYLCRAVGHPDTARDLAQEVFLRVSRSRVAINGDGTAWVFQVARNLVLDYWRSRSRRPEAAEPAGAVTRSASQDVRAAVNQALARLPTVDRDIFLLREVAGLGYEQIAQACELSPDAVRSRIYRARLQLRDELAAPIATSRTFAATRSGRTMVRTNE